MRHFACSAAVSRRHPFDQEEPLRVRSNEERLEHAVLANARRELLQVLFGEAATDVVRLVN